MTHLRILRDSPSSFWMRRCIDDFRRFEPYYCLTLTRSRNPNHTSVVISNVAISNVAYIFTRLVSVCSNTAGDGQEDGLGESFNRAQLLAKLLLGCRLCRHGSLCLTNWQVSIDRTSEHSVARSRTPVLFLWLCSTEDKPKVALSVNLLLALLGTGDGGLENKWRWIQTGLYEMWTAARIAARDRSWWQSYFLPYCLCFDNFVMFVVFAHVWAWKAELPNSCAPTRPVNCTALDRRPQVTGAINVWRSL